MTTYQLPSEEQEILAKILDMYINTSIARLLIAKSTRDRLKWITYSKNFSNWLSQVQSGDPISQDTLDGLKRMVQTYRDNRPHPAVIRLSLNTLYNTLQSLQPLPINTQNSTS